MKPNPEWEPPLDPAEPRTSLVAQDIQEVEADIQVHFLRPDAREFITRKAAARLLRTEVLTVNQTIDEIEVERGVSLRQAMVDERRDGAFSTLDQERLLLINRSPFIRSLHVFTVARRLGVRSRLVSEVARIEGIRPHVPRQVVPVTFHRKTPRHYLDKDQIAAVREGLTRMPAPDDFVSQSTLLEQMDMENLEKLKHKLDVVAPVFFNPLIGKSEPFFNSADAMMIIDMSRSVS